jgi:dihydropteroate synthase
MVVITPEELDIDYDLTINTGQGAATKEAQMNYLIMIMQQLFPALQSMGVVNEKSWYETAKDLFEKMGVRNVQNYLLDPDSDVFKQLQQQKAQQAQEAEQKELDKQILLMRTKLDSELQRSSIPRMSLNYKDLPIEAKDKAILDYLGIQVPEDDIAEKELFDAKIKGGNK